jgi:hypothetical protein
MRYAEVHFYYFITVHMMQGKKVMTTTDAVLCFPILVALYCYRKCSVPFVSKQIIL